MRGRGNRGQRRVGGRTPVGAGTEIPAGGEPLSVEEQEFEDGVEMGVPTLYQANMTTKEALELEAPALAMNAAPIGLVETIRNNVRVLSGQHGNEYITSTEHSKRYHNGNWTLFVDSEDKAVSVGSQREPTASKRYSTLNEDERLAILQTFVAGQYQKINPTAKEDTLGLIETYTKRNETYLPEDGETLKAKVQTLLPVQKEAQRQRQRARQ